MARRIEIMSSIARATLSGLLLLAVASCSSSKSADVEVLQGEALVERQTQDAAPPPGVVRYCWEEPMVALQQSRPGLNPEGTWYSPSYLAVREVRLGRWRPCRSPR